jgi:Bardet-Biedl syndrome 1 protein
MKYIFKTQTEPRIPAVAVASGSHIYIYKNMRPYFKFTLPTLEIHTTEKELWAAASSNEQPIGKTISTKLALIRSVDA